MESAPPEKRARRRSVRRVAIAAVLLAAVVSFPRGWGAAIAGRVVRGALDLDAPGSAACSVRYVSPFGFEARGVRIGSLPGAPGADRIEVRFSPWRLLRGRPDCVGRVEIEGLEAVFTNELASAGDLVPDPAVRLDFSLSRGPEGYAGAIRGGRLFGGALEGGLRSDPSCSNFTASLDCRPALHGLDLPPFAAGLEARLRPCAETSLVATADFGFADSSWKAVATVDLSTNGDFAADAALPAASLARRDALVAPLLAWSGATNLVAALSGSVTGALHVAKAADAPVAEWSAALRLIDVDADLMAGETPVALRGGTSLLRADGYGEKVRVRPFGLLYGSLRAGSGIALDSGSFWFRSDGLSSLLLTEGRTGFCGGTVRIYALHLDLEHLNAGFTLYLDDLQAGEILALLPGVDGSATGTVHGKIPLAYREGKIRLRDAYLYSPPGQVGKLRLTETDAVVENLRAAGVPDSTCDDLRRALANLDYTVLRLDLRQNRDGTGRLDVRLEGSATEENLTIPVSLDLGFNGQIQDLLNVGLRASAMGGN